MAAGGEGERFGIVVSVPAAAGEAARESSLRATLASLADQTDPLFDVVVAGADEISPPAVGLDPRTVRVVAGAGAGTVDRLEAGAALLATRWVRFLPAGDRLAPRCLEEERALLDEDASVAALFAEVEDVEADGSVADGPSARTGSLAHGPAAPALASGRYAAGSLLPELVEANPLPLGGALLRRDVLRELGGFDPSFEVRPEHDLWLRLLAGFEVRVRRGAGLRHVRERAVDPRVDGAEHARALLRALAGEGCEAFVAALGGVATDPAARGIACAELARRLLRACRPELRSVVRRLVRGSREAGAWFPADDPFRDLAADFPELARAEGWFAPPREARRRDAPPLAAGPPRFPPPVRVGLGTGGGTDGSAGIEEARRLLAHEQQLAQAGLELVVLHHRGARVSSVVPELGPRMEILRHAGSVDEAEAALVRLDVRLLVAGDRHPAAEAARRRGVPLRPWEAAASDDTAGALARAFLRDAASGSAAARRVARSGHVRAAARGEAAAFESGALEAIARALGDAGAGAHARIDGASPVDALAGARRDAATLRREVGEARILANRALDKLRIGRRLRATLSGLGGSGATGEDRVVSLDRERALRFLATAAQRGGRLWVVYTTDPYSETQGQRSTWLARELLARGDFVLFLYWRWHLSDEIASSPHERLLTVPIDQLFRLQRPLMDLDAPGLEKILLIEFPDAHLFEIIDLANAHGFTTVYDCVDDWEEFARVGHAHWYDPGVERHLVRHADVVVATHPALARRLEDLGRRPGPVPVVPNGVALDAFAGASPRPREGAPIVGYFGHLTRAWFDWNLVRETAIAHPEWTFEIYGHGAPDDLDLPANVHVPGPVAHAEIEARTRHWHVGIVPFVPGRLTRAVDPIKLYEYLALGLPSVVVDMPHLARVPGVEVCDREGFAAAVGRALRATLDRGAVADFVAGSAWQVRTEALCAAVAGAAREDVLKAL